jgi:CheY-like chemotaxis protein
LPDAPKLLVIEDAHDHATLVGIAARRAYPGLDVHVVHEGVSGVAYLSGMEPFEDRTEHPFPDLVILDLIMPEVDGFAVLRWIRKHLKDASLPVVVLTSSPNPEHARRARALGARAVYNKPADLSDLGTVVKSIVDTWIGQSRLIGAHLWAAG